MKPFSESTLSVISPVYGNEATLAELARRLSAVAKPLFRSVEIVFVNDCSPDGSRKVLKELCEKDSSVRAINLVRNFGQHAALVAGMRRVSSDYILLIDADLEESPEDLPAFMAKMTEGYEISVGLRGNERKSFLRRSLSSAFFRCYNLFSDFKIIANCTDMRLMTRRYVDLLLSFPERPHLAGITSWIGMPIGLVTVKRIEQKRKSAYGFLRLLRHARQALVGFSVRPMRISFYIGMLVTASALVYTLSIAVRYFLYHDVAVGYPSIMGLLSFLMGVQYVFLGVLGEYIGEIFISAKARPNYLIYDEFNRDPKQSEGAH